MKICSKCHKQKNNSEFYKDRNRKGGLTSWCKECQKKNYRDNIEEISKRVKKYYRNNIEKMREYGRKYAREHKTERRVYLSRPDIKEKTVKYQHDYYQNTMKAYRKTSKGLAKRREYHKKSMDKEMAWELMQKISNDNELDSKELRLAKRLIKRYKTNVDSSNDETYNIWVGLGEI